MTRRGKCDTCRLRKVKCDQERPCGSCCKKGRPCTYQAASFFDATRDPAKGSQCFSVSRSGRNVPLVLAHSKLAEHGAFYTFATGRPPNDLANAARLLSSRESRRAAKWIGMIRESSSGWSWFDRFVSCATAHIGSEHTVDSAIDFTLESYATFRHDWDPAWDQTAQRSGLTAMMALRHGLETTPDFDRTTLVITTGLLCLAELFRSIGGVLNYTVHMQACARLLASCTKAGGTSELEETLLYMIVLEEVTYAMLSGHRSAFTSLPIPPLRSLAKYGATQGFTEALCTIMNLLVRLSHLAQLLREYNPHLDDRFQALNIMAVMQSLFEAGDEVGFLVNDSAMAVPTKSPETARVLPQSCTFRSTYDFDLAVHYFTYRVILCGMIQSFYDTLPPIDADQMNFFVDISAVQQADEATSRKIAMCIEYSHDCPDAPCVPLRFKTALTQGYGSLNRIQARKAAEGRMREAIEAARLKQLCYQSGLRTLRMWGVGVDGVSEEYFGSHYRGAVGGPPFQLEEYFDEDGYFHPG